MASFRVNLFDALRASTRVVANFYGLTLEADPISFGPDENKPVRLSANSGDYVIHVCNQPVEIDEGGGTAFVDIEGNACDAELTVQRPLEELDLTGSSAAAEELPWCDCKVAFDCGDQDALWRAQDAGKLQLPKGWTLDETDCAGARCVAVFRVDGVPSITAGQAVRAAIARVMLREVA